MVQLIPDVLPFVFAHLAKPDWVSCARVCRDWVEPAQKQLYTVVNPTSLAQVARLTAALAGSPQLGLLTRGVRFRPAGAASATGEYIAAQEAVMPPLLSFLPRLECFAVVALNSSTERTVAALGGLTGLQVVMATVGDIALPHVGKGGPVVDLLYRNPNIQFLCLHGEMIIPPGFSWVDRCPAAFVRLRVAAKQHTDRALEYLVSSSQNSLLDLDCLDPGLNTVLNIQIALETDTARLLGQLGPVRAPLEALTEPGLIRILAPLNLFALRLVALCLTPAGLNKILSGMPRLVTLGIGLTSLDGRGLAAAPPTLRVLELSQVLDVLSEAALRAAIQPLKACPLGRVDTLVLRLRNRGIAAEAKSIAQKRGLTVTEAGPPFVERPPQSEPGARV